MSVGLLPSNPVESSKVRKKREQQEEQAFLQIDKAPRLFKHLQLAEDGGLEHEAHALFKPMRLIGTISTMVVVCLNVAVIVRVNLQILREKRLRVPTNRRLNLLELVVRWVYPETNFVAEELVAYYELVVLGLMLLLACYYLLEATCKRRGRFHRWLCAARFFLELVPELKHFSAMRALERVQPYVAQREIKAKLADLRARRAVGESAQRCWLAVLVFLVTRALIFIFGFDAFVVKFRVAAELAQEVTPRSFLRLVIFLNQMLGVVSLERFTMRRLSNFIFGGEDNIVSPGEERLLMAYTAKLFERIWTGPHSSCIKSFAVSMTFNDEDFQRLMLNEWQISAPLAEPDPSTKRAATTPNLGDGGRLRPNSLPTAKLLPFLGGENTLGNGRAPKLATKPAKVVRMPPTVVHGEKIGSLL